MIKVENIYYRINQREILKNISLCVDMHEIRAVIGESGSGKTTLLRLLAALLIPTEGKVLFEENDLITFSTHLIKGHSDIKLVAQDFSLFPNLSVSENIAYSIRNFKKDYVAERLNVLLKLMGLETIKDALPKNISGGEKQRTAIAKAIADEPKVLLLDEPFSQLDSINKARLKASLKALVRNENIACVFVTHDMIDALTFSDKYLVLRNGTMVGKGKIQNLFSSQDAYIQEFVTEAILPMLSLVDKLKLNQK